MTKIDNPIEKVIQKKVNAFLKGEGIFFYHPSSMHSKGTPDLLICYRGLFVAIELKRPKEEYTVTKLQAKKLKHIEDTGGKAFVAHSVPEVEAILTQLDKEIDDGN
jgi:Holliday junction resolvase